MTQAFSGNVYIQSIVGAEITEFSQRARGTAASPVELVQRLRFNPELNKGWFGAVMNVVLSITMLSIVLTGAALIREREHGTIEHLLAMPVTPFEIMTSKVWSMGLVVLAASALSLIVVVQGMLGVPIEGSIPLFLLGAALLLFATTSLGIFLASIAGSMPQFGLLLMMVLLPLQMLSGGMTRARACPRSSRRSCWRRPTPISSSSPRRCCSAGRGSTWSGRSCSPSSASALRCLPCRCGASGVSCAERAFQERAYFAPQKERALSVHWPKPVATMLRMTVQT